MLNGRDEEARKLLKTANIALLQLWQMTYGADGTPEDIRIARHCTQAQVHIDEAGKCLAPPSKEPNHNS